eukprot:10187851-Lingulodinium_polyedra.AAC.1
MPGFMITQGSDQRSRVAWHCSSSMPGTAATASQVGMGAVARQWKWEVVVKVKIGMEVHGGSRRFGTVRSWLRTASSGLPS